MTSSITITQCSIEQLAARSLAITLECMPASDIEGDAWMRLTKALCRTMRAAAAALCKRVKKNALRHHGTDPGGGNRALTHLVCLEAITIYIKIHYAKRHLCN